MATTKQPQTITITPGDRITAAEYAAMPPEQGWRTELFRGVVVRMPLIKDLRHEWVAGNLYAALHAYITPRRSGRASMEQGGYNATLPGETDETIWGPDVAFISAERLPAALSSIARGDYAPAPDLAAEVVSASQSRPEMAERAQRWLAAGTRLVWNVWPESQTVDVWTPDTPMYTLSLRDTLDGLDVIPDFSLPVAGLFA
ncbi:MAG TPA: Uma2 family endonuclease [Ktedonobacterales bacterium]|jgi:Uma2 family endonuclease